MMISLIAKGFAQRFNWSHDPAVPQPIPTDDDIGRDRAMMQQMTGTPSENFAAIRA